MKKFKTNQDRLDDLKKRGDLIKESFLNEFNKIRRVDESPINEFNPPTDKISINTDIYNERFFWAGIRISGKPQLSPDGYSANYPNSKVIKMLLVDYEDERLKPHNIYDITNIDNNKIEKMAEELNDYGGKVEGLQSIDNETFEQLTKEKHPNGLSVAEAQMDEELREFKAERGEYGENPRDYDGDPRDYIER